MKAFNVLGVFRIDRETDILAFAAFLLSLTSIAYQGASMLRGPKVMLFPPRQVTVHASGLDGSGEKYLTFITSMEYVNSAQPGINDVVSEESVSFALAGRIYTHFWHQFVTAVQRDDDGGVGEVASHRLDIRAERSVHPFVVTGGGADAHETLFAARSKYCPQGDDKCDPDINFVTLSTFVRALSDLLPEKAPVSEIPIRFTFTATTLRGANKTTACIVYVTRSHIQYLESPNMGWASLMCQRSEMSDAG